MSLKFSVTLLICYFLLTLPLQAADDPPASSTKFLYASRITSPPDIDGSLNEDVWQKTRCGAMDFVQRSPNPGGLPSVPTEVKILYDDDAIYVGAFLYDISADSIMREYSQRDDFGFSDVFGVYFDTYEDGINAFEFLVTAAGVQIDRRWTANGRDESWNAAWLSEVRRVGTDWFVEIQIPMSALRFPKTPIQQWGVNFRRSIRRNNELNYWNEIDPEANGFVNQFGRLDGITNIKSPLRLSVSPYVSTYYDRYSGDPENPASTNTRFNGGMDLRYGINDAFTLDMILVPDFGQVVSDNRVLNLSPFEVKFSENRQFFKEGTDLFEKGDFFYSRRIGGKPLRYDQVEDQLANGEEVVANPQESSLINATKVSGRTASGFGVGVFNALTGTMQARVVNSETGEGRQIVTSPLTNYSVIALDQSLKNNSYVSFVNTNVLRQGEFYDANLTGTVFKLSNRGNRFTVSGRGAVSQKYGFEDSHEYGYTSSLSLAKTSGNLRASITNYIESDTYDPNDLGYLRANNEVRTSANVGYNIYRPFWRLLNLYSDIYASYSRLYSPSTYTRTNLSASVNGTFRSFNSMRLTYEISPTKEYDYFEPRVDGRYVVFPSYYSLGMSFNTDGRNRLAVGTYVGYTDYDFQDQRRLRFSVSPRFRVNNRLSFSASTSYNARLSDVGFAEKQEVAQDEYRIIFGRRNIKTISNILNTKYTFTNKMGLSFRMRHYWSEAAYQEFYNLSDQGTYLSSKYQGNENRNYNAFNVDMVYRYTFAPASEVSVVWKNSIINDADQLRDGYFANVNTMLDAPKSNSISVRILYFIDYSTMVKRLRRNKL